MSDLPQRVEADANAPIEKRGRGRPKGAKNKVSKEARSYFLRLWRDKAFRKKFADDWRRGKVPPPLMVAAAHYAFGKPVEEVNINGDTEQRPTAFVLVINGKVLSPGDNGGRHTDPGADNDGNT